MCLGIPSKIIRINDSMATIDVYGAQRDISIMLLENQVKVGDYVLVHAGFAIQKLDKKEAKETLKLFDQYLDMLNEEEKSPIKREEQDNYKKTKTKRKKQLVS